MKYSLSVTNKFRKTVKLARKRGLNINLLNNIVDTLQKGKELDEKYCDIQISLIKNKRAWTKPRTLVFAAVM